MRIIKRVEKDRCTENKKKMREIEIEMYWE
jgi:hypothetical protein